MPLIKGWRWWLPPEQRMQGSNTWRVFNIARPGKCVPVVAVGDKFNFPSAEKIKQPLR